MPEKPRGEQPIEIGRFQTEAAKHRDAVDILANQNHIFDCLVTADALIRRCDASAVGNEVCAFMDDWYVRVMDNVKESIVNEKGDVDIHAREDLSRLVLAREDKEDAGAPYFSRDDQAAEIALWKSAQDAGEPEESAGWRDTLSFGPKRRVRSKRKRFEAEVKESAAHEQERGAAREAYAARVREAGKTVDLKTAASEAEHLLRVAEMITAVQRVLGGDIESSKETVSLSTKDLSDFDSLLPPSSVTPRQKIKAQAVQTALGRYAKHPDTATEAALEKVYSDLLFSLNLERQLEGIKERMEDAIQRIEEAIADRMSRVTGLGTLYQTLSPDRMPPKEDLDALNTDFQLLKKEHDQVRVKLAELLNKIGLGVKAPDESGQHPREEELEGLALFLNEASIDDLYLSKFFAHLKTLDERIQTLSALFRKAQEPLRLSVRREESIALPNKSRSGRSDKFSRREGEEQYQEMKTIFGEKGFFGIEENEYAFTLKNGIKLIELTQEERDMAGHLLFEKRKESDVQSFLELLKNDRELAKMWGLHLRVPWISADGHRIPLTMKTLETHLAPDMRTRDQGKLLYDVSWYREEAFYRMQQPGNTDTTPSAIQSSGGLGRMEWRFVTRDVLPETLNKNHTRQWTLLQEEARFFGLDPKKIRRRLPVETVHDFAVRLRAADDRTMAGRYDWSDVRSSDGGLVFVGRGDRYGLSVSGDHPGGRGGNLGASLSR